MVVELRCHPQSRPGSEFHLNKEVIFEVDFVCVVSRRSKFERAITLKQYLAADHVAVDIIGGVQTHPDKHLAAIGEKRCESSRY